LALVLLQRGSAHLDAREDVPGNKYECCLEAIGFKKSSNHDGLVIAIADAAGDGLKRRGEVVEPASRIDLVAIFFRTTPSIRTMRVERAGSRLPVESVRQATDRGKSVVVDDNLPQPSEELGGRSSRDLPALRRRWRGVVRCIAHCMAVQVSGWLLKGFSYRGTALDCRPRA
jgi:hypothetical protein